MAKLPKISIVTPSYNQGHFIEEAIRSVLDQGYPDVEHIVLDNCSDDGTVETLRRYPHLTWISERDRGQRDALNRGFKLATGEIVGWLNADDRYLPGSLRAVADFLQERREVDVVYGDYRWIDREGAVTQRRREHGFDRFVLKNLPMLYIHTASTFFRRRVFDDDNLLDLSYHYVMDYEYFMRLIEKGYRIAHLDEFLADFRWHETNKSHSNKWMGEHERAFLSYSPVLSRAPQPLLRTARASLQAIARMKRFAMKAAHGFYFQQWSRS